MPNGDEWPSEFPPVPHPTAATPIVPALPPELKQFLEYLRSLGWWFGTDLYLVLCGHSFDEEVISMEVEVEDSTSVGLSYFENEAWSQAAKQLEEDIKALAGKYVCFKETKADDDCELVLKSGPVTVEFFEYETDWKPADKAKVTKKIRLGFPTRRETYYVRARARAIVHISCEHK